MVIKVVNNVLEEMARVGYTDDNYEIFVFTNDSGNIPHFHYRSDNKKFNTCICIEKCSYFLHGNKQDKLNSSQRKSLDKFMGSECKITKHFTGTYWDYVVSLWNANNSSIKIDENNVNKPDYTKLR